MIIQGSVSTSARDDLWDERIVREADLSLTHLFIYAILLKNKRGIRYAA